MTNYEWVSGGAYERFMGRWSRQVANSFLRWLGVPPQTDWLEVGCGTGALTSAILDTEDPGRVRAFDLSLEFVESARERVEDPRVKFGQADARALPEPNASFGAAVSGLLLNFVPDPSLAVAEMKRVTRPGGLVGVYVWDYAEGMQVLRMFWDAAVELNPGAGELDEGTRFALCHPEVLRDLFRAADLRAIEVSAIEVPTRFVNFEDFWEPFLGGQGPAPGYVASLDEQSRSKLRNELDSRLPRRADGSIELVARAWTIRGRVYS